MKRIFLIAAILPGLVAALSGCGLAEPDEYAAKIFVFNNRTDAEVVLEACDGDVSLYRWTIEPGKALRQVVPSETNTTHARVSEPYSAFSVFNCREARIVFGGVRELRFSSDDTSSPYNIYNSDNYSLGAFDDESVEWHYNIDAEVKGAATIIKE